RPQCGDHPESRCDLVAGSSVVAGTQARRGLEPKQRPGASTGPGSKGVEETCPTASPGWLDRYAVCAGRTTCCEPPTSMCPVLSAPGHIGIWPGIFRCLTAVSTAGWSVS